MKKQVKIGTITYWWTQDNYGQVLQCYALIDFLRRLGYDAFLIRCWPMPSKHGFLTLIKKALRYLCSSKYRRTAFMWRRLGRISAEENRKHPRHFDDFRSRYIPSTEEYDWDSLKREPPLADAYVCGSDQIWGTPSPLYFLQFGSSEVKRIAYAPSLGGIRPKGKSKRLMSKYLQEFDYISSRESEGVKVIHEMGFPNALQQPDPTLLLPVTTYRHIAQPPANNQPYALIYLLGNETEVAVEELHDYFRTQGLEVRYVASQGRVDNFDKLYPTVEEWLGLIEHATCVVTNSFHGTVFCLQFNTPFLVFPVKGAIVRMNNRINELLTRYGLHDRIYFGSLDKLFDAVNFGVFNSLRAEEEDNVRELFSELLQEN